MSRFIIINNWHTSFLNYRIKNKAGIINIWIEILKKLVLKDYEITKKIPQIRKNEIIIISGIDNDNPRIFMADPNEENHKKMVSISCPLSISFKKIDDGEIDAIEVKIFNEDISEKKLILIKHVINRLVEDNEIKPIDYAISEGTREYDEEIEQTSNDNIDNSFLYEFITRILSFEEGYIRYDFDEKNSSEKVDEYDKKYLHPTYHLDIFLHTYSTFKVGLSKKINIIDFQNILDPNINCHFLNNINNIKDKK